MLDLERVVPSDKLTRLDVLIARKMMSTERLLADVVLMLQYHKLNTMFLAYVPTVIQKGNTETLMVSPYQALKKRRHF